MTEGQGGHSFTENRNPDKDAHPKINCLKYSEASKYPSYTWLCMTNQVFDRDFVENVSS